MRLLSIEPSSIVLVVCTGCRPTHQRRERLGASGTKMLMRFEQQSAGLAEAHPATPGTVLVFAK